MCTMILGRDVVAPGSILVAANRDEDPARPSDPPGVLAESPRVVGGRDRRAGGTWLAVREARAVVAVLNRRDRSGEPAPAVPGRRSRGLLALEVASVDENRPARIDPPGDRAGHARLREDLRSVSGGGLSDAALRHALAALREAPHAPCTLVFAASDACWLVAHDGTGEPCVVPVRPGWHALTHADLDDPSEPRTARLVRELAGFAPRSIAEAEQRLDALLRSHGEPASDPPVCLHAGRMVTVSSSSVWLAPGEARFRHAEGRPCEHALRDLTHLLRAPARASERR